MNPTLAFCLIMLTAFSIPLLIQRFGKQFLTALLPTYLIIGNVFALSFVKLFDRFETSLAVAIYCGTFLIVNIITEHFGKEEAKKAIYLGFLGQIILVIVSFIIINTGIQGDINNAYNTVFNPLPRIVFASFLAYFTSQFLDIFTFTILKQKGTLLGVRNFISTSVAQLIDTSIIIGIAFYDVGIYKDNNTLLINFILTTWIIKVLVAIADTPFIYISKILYGSKK